MKKFIRTMLVLVLALVSFGLVACDDNSAPALNAQDAIKMLLVGQDTYVTEDFSVPGTLNYKGEKYPLTWTSNNVHLAVSAEVDANGNYVIDATIPETDAQYVTLTATLKIGESTASKSFEFSLYPVSVFEIGEAYEFAYHKKSTSEAMKLDSEFTFEGKTATIAWSIPEAYQSILTIADGKASFDEVSKVTEVQITATFSYKNETFERTFKVNLVPGASAPMIMTEFADGDTFKWGLFQGNLGKYLYFAGEASSESTPWYMKTTEDAEAATDVTVRVVDGGYHLTFVDSTGATKYLDITQGEKTNILIKDAPENVWTFDETHQTFVQTFTDSAYYVGTYNTFNTFSASKISYAETSFPSHMYVLPHAVVDTPVVDTNYKLGTSQENLKKVLYFAGKVSSVDTPWYLATTSNPNNAVDVKVVATDGGYHLTFVDAEGATKYLNIVSGSKVNVLIEDAPSCVWTYNTEYKTYVVDVDGTEYYVGTYNTFNTLSASKLSYASTSFPSHMYALVQKDADNGSDDTGSDDTGSDDTTGGEITIAKALEIAATKSHDTYTTEKYTITGTVASISNTTYGNMTVTDGTNIITVYGTYSADGSSRFDAMTSKPSVGDTITVTGILGLYGSTKQMKNGWILSFTAHTHSYGEATCKEPAKCTICGVKKDDVLSSNHNYVDGLCTVCGGVDPDYEGEVVVPEGDMVADALALSFSNAKKDENANTYLESNFPKWTRDGNLGKNYAGYLGFGKGDKTCSITSGKFYATSDFKVSAVLKGNGSKGTMTSTVKFELLDANGDVVATGYANGSSTAEFTPKDGTETTYTITFTYVAGKTYKDATNLRLSFSKATGNVSFKSLSVVA